MVKSPKGRACSSIGRVFPWHGKGSRFDPDQVHFFVCYDLSNNSIKKGAKQGSFSRKVLVVQWIEQKPPKF